MLVEYRVRKRRSQEKDQERENKWPDLALAVSDSTLFFGLEQLDIDL